MRASEKDATPRPVTSDPPTAPGWKSAALAIAWFVGFCAVGWTVGPRLAGHGLARWGNAPWPLALGAAIARAAARTWGAMNLVEARHQVLAEQFWPTHDLLWTVAAAAFAGGAVTQLARQKELGHLFTLLAAAAWLAAWMLRAS